jgi:hypothetical protein
MKALESVLREELARLKEVGKGYAQEIERLPLGSLQEKKIKEISYPYHVVSRKGKVRCEYVGRLSPEELRRLKEKIALRKKYKNLLKEVHSNRKQVERALRGRK